MDNFNWLLLETRRENKELGEKIKPIDLWLIDINDLIPVINVAVICEYS